MHKKLLIIDFLTIRRGILIFPFKIYCESIKYKKTRINDDIINRNIYICTKNTWNFE